MISTATLPLTGDLKITVPDSLDLITTYVLREQGDWFEDEIKFVRSLLRPGEKVIDIGANYGVYTLTMAKAVGPAGCVWAFEPASGTATLLSESVSTNKMDNVVVEQAAVSCRSGVAKLSLNANSELNSLLHDSQPGGMTETVPLTTLDEYVELHDLKEVVFLKLDAEGEEENILRGGVRFFSTQSPLIQYEVRAGGELHLELVSEFIKLGYFSYRLVPGLNILVPFREGDQADGYLLNLFCCKPDRAEKLAKVGVLVKVDAIVDHASVQPETDCSESYDSGTCGWLDALIKLPYGKILAESWEQTVSGGMCAEVKTALWCYSIAQQESLSAVQRFNALDRSFRKLKNICERQPDYLRLSSLARVAREYGSRSISVKALSVLCNALFQRHEVNSREPFLAPCRRFDNVSPGQSLVNWIAAAALEEFELNCAFSSFYTGLQAKQRLVAIRNLGFASDEMNRRLDLVEQRFPAAIP